MGLAVSLIGLGLSVIFGGRQFSAEKSKNVFRIVAWLAGLWMVGSACYKVGVQSEGKNDEASLCPGRS